MQKAQTRETSACSLPKSSSLNMLLLLLRQLLAITTLPCSASNATQLVYDTEGNVLSSKQNYYILPAKRASGRGLRALPTGLRCLHFVFQERSEAVLGTALWFTPLPEHASASEPIRLSSDICIEFHDFDSFCSKRLDWHLTGQVPESSSGEPKHVAAGSEEGLRSFAVFRVEKHGTGLLGYKIVSCVDKGPCKDLKMEMPQTRETSTCNLPKSFSLNMFFLLHLLAITTLPCSANNATQLVYDIEGNVLNSKSNYYILPAKPASGGGLKAVPTGLRCLHFVVEERSETLLGTPLRFTPLPEHASATEPIRLSSDIWIKFHDLRSFCSDVLDWHLTGQVPESSSGEPKHVAAGSEEGLRSFGVFRVERHGIDLSGYKIVSCVDKGPCRDLGLHVYKDKTWLTEKDYIGGFLLASRGDPCRHVHCIATVVSMLCNVFHHFRITRY
uniref:Alpha-amylase/subtilisin inhibitor n=2 Tax=Aegilops tauschii TaxID=37682 RepID=R7WBZ2_AEGTA